MKSKEIDPKEVLIEIDPISTPKITNGVFDQDTRELRFTVVGDGEVEESEIELLRATAEAIGAPIPPMVRVIS